MKVFTSSFFSCSPRFDSKLLWYGYMTTHGDASKTFQHHCLLVAFKMLFFLGRMLPSPLPVAMEVKIDMGIPKHL